MEEKIKLLDNLRHHIYCRLGSSRIHGVGVFAIRPIPRGVDPFQIPNSIPEHVILLDAEEILKLPHPVQKLIRSFFCPVSGGKYPVLSQGLNSMNISYYLNHSITPNITLVPGDSDYYQFRTIRPIPVGEELTFNYYSDSSL